MQEFGISKVYSGFSGVVSRVPLLLGFRLRISSLYLTLTLTLTQTLTLTLTLWPYKALLCRVMQNVTYGAWCYVDNSHILYGATDSSQSVQYVYQISLSQSKRFRRYKESKSCQQLGLNPGPCNLKSSVLLECPLSLRWRQFQPNLVLM